MTTTLLAVLAAVCSQGAVADREHPVLVPAPAQVDWVPGEPVKLPPGKVVIILGAKSAEPEKSAAALLQRNVKKRFGLDWPVFTEDSKEGRAALTPDGSEVIVLLAQRTTSPLLDRLARQARIELSAESPGHDGYVITHARQAKRHIVIVGGSNARGVIYGQDTLFQMLDRRGEDVVLRRAGVRDKPSIPWRGRPQTNVELYLNPGEMDLYMTARINFIDLRNGIYAYNPGDTFDEAVVKRVVTEAHRCGIVVFATINCGIPKNQHVTILKMYEQFLALGADGLWLSFDDKGPGEAPEELTRTVLDLGRRHNVTGSLIAITPPKGAYQKILMPFNRKIMAVPGMESALWFWTSLPLPEAVRDARSIGMKALPSWWHNWTRPDAGFAHGENGSLMAGERVGYMGVPPMAEGWGAPTYRLLAESAGSAEAIMPWGGNGWGQYCIMPVIGWWGWAPDRHDFEAVRGRIHNIVFGPGQVEAARQFDNDLHRAWTCFRFVENESEAEPMCPGRLRNQADREKVAAILRGMREQLATVQKGAPTGTLLEEKMLTSHYLQPMTAELTCAEAENELAYPEYWWLDHQRELLAAVYAGDDAKADTLIEKTRPRVLAELEQVGKRLGKLRMVPSYVKWWRERASWKAADWRRHISERRTLLASRVKDYNGRAAQTAVMLKDLANPPTDWGTGRWEATNRVLATVLPTDREMFWGEWIGGLYENGDMKAAVFAMDPKTIGTPGGFAELEVRLPVSGDRKRLALLLFLSDVNKENVGFDYVRNRMSGYREATLSWGDRTLWREDVGIQRESGQWFLARLPEIPADVKEMPLRLRVGDVKETDKNFCIVYVGPIRLIELGEFQPE